MSNRDCAKSRLYTLLSSINLLSDLDNAPEFKMVNVVFGEGQEFGGKLRTLLASTTHYSGLIDALFRHLGMSHITFEVGTRGFNATRRATLVTYKLAALPHRKASTLLTTTT